VPWNCAPQREAKGARPEMLIVPEGNLTVQGTGPDRIGGWRVPRIIKSLFFKGITPTVTQTLDLSRSKRSSDEFGVAGPGRRRPGAARRRSDDARKATSCT